MASLFNSLLILHFPILPNGFAEEIPSIPEVPLNAKHTNIASDLPLTRHQCRCTQVVIGRLAYHTPEHNGEDARALRCPGPAPS